MGVSLQHLLETERELAKLERELAKQDGERSGRFVARRKIEPVGERAGCRAERESAFPFGWFSLSLQLRQWPMSALGL